MTHKKSVHAHHTVHELHRPQGHGFMDQKYDKGNRSPIAGSVPVVDSGDEMPAIDGMPMVPDTDNDGM
jgi:hypothetical protein